MSNYRQKSGRHEHEMAKHRRPKTNIRLQTKVRQICARNSKTRELEGQRPILNYKSHRYRLQENG